MVVCVAHLYGVTLYYATNWAEGVSYSRPEFLYYWVYYAGFNAPWVFVPGGRSSPHHTPPSSRTDPCTVLIADSFSQISKAFHALRLHSHTD